MSFSIRIFILDFSSVRWPEWRSCFKSRMQPCFENIGFCQCISINFFSKNRTRSPEEEERDGVLSGNSVRLDNSIFYYPLICFKVS